MSFEESFSNAMTRVGIQNNTLAEAIGVSEVTVSRWKNGKSSPDDRNNLLKCIEPLGFAEYENGLEDFQELLQTAGHEPLTLQDKQKYFPKAKRLVRQDWGEAPDVPTVFVGRDEDLKTLKQWITTEKCRLVALFGLGGIGKTDLSRKLSDIIKEHFEGVIWRSLLNAPPPTEILSDLLKFVSNQPEIDIPTKPEAQIRRLLEYLRRHRYLIILDNFETVLQSGKAGQYQPGYEAYGKLLNELGTSFHQSCLLLNSREKPTEVTHSTEKNGKVRSLDLIGLDIDDGKKIFDKIGNFSADTEKDWDTLIELYRGNPLALKLVAKHIDEVFFRNISEFLSMEYQVFGDLKTLLDWHFDRLNHLEQEVMFWLAINREPVSLPELKSNKDDKGDILCEESRNQLPSTLQSLQRRIPLEKHKHDKGFTLQPVLIEYMTEQFIEQIVNEIETGHISFLNCYAIIKATAKDHVRNTQIRLILNPIWDRFVIKKGQTWLKNQLQHILATLRQQQDLPGYAAGNVLNMLGQRLDIVKNYDFSDLNIRQAYLQGVKLQNVNFARASFEKLWFTQTFGSILCLAFSADGELLATGDFKYKINLWQNGNNIATFQGHSNVIWSLAFSADGQFIASGSLDKTAKLWDIKKSRCLFNFQHEASVWSVAFKPDAHILASSDEKGLVKFWDVHNGECVKTLEAHKLGIWSIAFSPDGQFLATASSDTTVKIWDCQKDYQCIQTLEGHQSFVRAVAFSPDSQLLASGADDMTIKIWELHKNDAQTEFKEKHYEKPLTHSNIIRSIAFSPDGKNLASGSDDEKVRIWSINTGECSQVLSHDNVVSSVAFDPKEKTTLVCGDEAKTVKTWDYKKGISLQNWQGSSRIIRAVAISPDGQTIASGHDDHTVRLWDRHQQKPLKILAGHTHRVWTVAFSPDGEMLASGGSDKTVRLWNLDNENWQPIQKLEAGNNNWVFSVAFSLDSQMIVGVGTDHQVKVWEVNSSQLQQILQEHISLIWSVVFSPDGKYLATASEDTLIKIWDIENGECLHTLQSPERLRSVAFSPNNRFLASSGGDHKVRLWDIQNNYQCINELQADGTIMSVAFSPDNQTIAGGSEKGTIQIWNIKSGSCKTLQHSNRSDEWLEVWSVAFSLDGQTLVSGSADGTIKLWNPKNGDCEGTLKVPGPYEDMNITGVTGLTDVQKISLKELGAIETNQS
jgi:WD40 repeat protein/transcriptional regulator with XRE-family HTH domain